MPDQIIGYYNSRKGRLLKEFDRTFVLIKQSLEARYSEKFVSIFQRETRQEFEKLIPEIPFIKGGRARMLNAFLLITAQELAVYKAMNKQGKPPEEAWELCHRALRLRVAEIPHWKRWLLKKLMFSNLVKRIMAKRAKQQETTCFGDFEIRYLFSEEGDFDVGVNYLQCGNYHFALKHGGEAFAPYICMTDIVLSDAMGWGLTRTQTLADGCDYCDFRMKSGAVTKISSKTIKVQETIERIRRAEIEQGRVIDG